MNISSAGTDGVLKNWSLVDFEAADMSGWVEVESAEQIRKGAANRVTGTELDHVEQIDSPSAKCGSIAEWLKTETLRRTIVDVSREQLDTALGKGAVSPKAFAILDLRRRAASRAMEDLDSLTGRDIAMSGFMKEGEKAPSIGAEKARAWLNDAVRSQEEYASALDDYIEMLPPEDNQRRTELKDISARVRKRIELIVGLRENLKQVVDAAERAGVQLDKLVALNRRGYATEIYKQEVRCDDSDFEKLTAFTTEYRKLNEAYGKGSRASAVDAVANVFRLQVSELKMPPVVGKLTAKNNLDGTTYKRYASVVNSFAAYTTALAKLVDACRQAAVEPDGKPIGPKSKEVIGVREAEEKLKKDLRDLAETKNLKAFLPKDDIMEIDRLGYSKSWGARVDAICTAFGSQTLESVQKAMTDDRDLAAVLVGRTPFSSAVEAKIWNPGRDYRNDLDGRDLVDEKVLGQGAFNTVKLCTFGSMDATPVECVFRSELGAVSSLRHGAISRFIMDEESRLGGFVCNDIAQELANLVGCQDVFPQTTFGTLHGEPGMFLEKAPGMSGGNFPRSSYDQGDLRDMAEEDRIKAAGKVAKRLNRLQWLDILTGQVDRHMNNVMIGVTKGGDVSVKGIDNDECFPDCDIGGGRYAFKSVDEASDWLMRIARGWAKNGKIQAKDCKSFLAPKLKPYAQVFNGENETDREARGIFDRDPKWNEAVILDINALPVDIQREIVGSYNNFGRPDHVDVELKQTLKNVMLENYGRTLADRGLSGRQVMAAKLRLLYVRSEMEKSECREIGANDWQHIARERLDATRDIFLNEDNYYVRSGFEWYMGI